jgi:hypothetical protein
MPAALLARRSTVIKKIVKIGRPGFRATKAGGVSWFRRAPRASMLMCVHTRVCVCMCVCVCMRLGTGA